MSPPTIDALVHWAMLGVCDQEHTSEGEHVGQVVELLALLHLPPRHLPRESESQQVTSLSLPPERGERETKGYEPSDHRRPRTLGHARGL